MLKIIKALPSEVLDKIHHASAKELQERGVVKTWATGYNPENPEAQKILGKDDK